MSYPTRTYVFIGLLCVLAAGAGALTLTLTGNAWGDRWWIAPAFAAVLMVGSLNNLRRTVRGREGISTTHEESLLVALLFLAPAAAILVSLTVQTVLAMAVLRRAPLKAAFNVAKMTLGVSGCLLVAGPQLPVEPNGLGALAAVAGVTVFIAVDHLSLAGVMSAIGATRARDYLRDDLGGVALVWVANVAIGLVAGIAATVDTWLLPIALAAMLPLHFALSGHVRARVQRQRLEEVIAASSDGIVALDRSGRVKIWSAAMERITGRSAAEVAGLRIGDALVLADDQGDALDVLAGTGERRTAALDHEDGRRSLQLSRALLPDEGHVLVVHDATAALLLQEELAAREQQLVEAQKMETVGHLTGGIAHDFNNLLVAIAGYGELALHALEPTHPARADVAEILKASDRGTALTRHLLDHSRRRPLEVQRLDLVATVDELAPLLHRLVGGGVRIDLKHAEPDIAVDADATQLAQIVLNLVVNARDATAEGGEISIRTRRDGECVVLEVSDTGTGMDPLTAAQAFDPLFTTKPAGEGTGLGLSTVDRIVRHAGGTVTVHSELGRGSTFLVSLPAAGCAPTPAAVDAARREPTAVAD